MDVNFTIIKLRFFYTIMSVHYDSYLFVNNIQQYKFKAKDSEIKTRKLCLGGFSNDYSYKQNL